MHSGWLIKESPKKKLSVAVQQRRYFVLESESALLRYFKTVPPAEIAGQISLNGAVLRVVSARDFEIVDPRHGRCFKLQAERAEEAAKWIASLGAVQGVVVHSPAPPNEASARAAPAS